MPLEVEKTNPLGEGVFATVYKGRDTSRGLDLAIKVYNDDFGGYETQLHQCRAEFAFLKRLTHPNIIRAIGIGDEGPDRPVCMLMAFAPSGDLHGLLRTAGTAGISPSASRSIISGISEALVYLHTVQSLLHGDIKPENVLLDGDTPLLCDFDAALPFGTPMPQPRGTAAYHPPEYPDPMSTDGNNVESADELTAGGAADVWATGMVILMIFTGLDPENVAEPPGEGYWRWPGTKNDRRRNPWPSMGPAMLALVEGILRAPIPEQRLTAESLASQTAEDSKLTEELATFRREWSLIEAATFRHKSSQGYASDDGRALLHSTSPTSPPMEENQGFIQILCGKLQGLSESCTIM